MEVPPLMSIHANYTDVAYRPPATQERMRVRLGVTACYLVAWCVAVGLAQAADDSQELAAYLAALPDCAVVCLAQEVPRSSCSPEDKTCLCDNAELQRGVEACVLAGCHVRESLTMRNLTDVSCHAPVRDRSAAYNTVSVTLGSLSAVFVLARLWFNGRVRRHDMGLGPDDWLILATVLFGVPSSILNTQGLLANGLGRDVWKVSFAQIEGLGRAIYIMEVLYFLQLVLLKLALLFFYLRIFPGRAARRLLWGTVVFNVLYGAVFVFTGIFQCQPIEFYWKKWNGEAQGTCINVNGLAWSNAAISIMVDCWMLAIPLWQLKGLKMSTKKKLGVGAMFGVGTFFTVVSILRLHSLLGFAASMNPTWDQWDMGFWSTIEVNTGIMCTCMPSIGTMIVRYWPKLRGARRTVGSKAKTSDPLSGRQTTGENHPDQKWGPSAEARRVLSHDSYGMQVGQDTDEVGLVEITRMRSKGQGSMESDSSVKV